MVSKREPPSLRIFILRTDQNSYLSKKSKLVIDPGIVSRKIGVESKGDVQQFNLFNLGLFGTLLQYHIFQLKKEAPFEIVH